MTPTKMILANCSKQELGTVLNRFPSYSKTYRKAHDEFMERID